METRRHVPRRRSVRRRQGREDGEAPLVARASRQAAVLLLDEAIKRLLDEFTQRGTPAGAALAQQLELLQGVDLISVDVEGMANLRPVVRPAGASVGSLFIRPFVRSVDRSVGRPFGQLTGGSGPLRLDRSVVRSVVR